MAQIFTKKGKINTPKAIHYKKGAVYDTPGHKLTENA